MTQYKIAKNFKDIQWIARYCQQTKWCSFDFETRALGPDGPSMTPKDKKPVGFQFPQDEPTIVAISFQPGSAWVIPLYHDESPFNKPQLKRIWKF